MRRYLIASHAHLSTGLAEALSFLVGERDDLTTLALFVDGNDDVEAIVEGAIAECPEDGDLVVMTDILGGSVNNEFVKALASRDRTYLVTNTNLPTAISIVFSDESRPTDEAIREVLATPEVAPTFVNDRLAAQDEDDEDF